MSRILLLCSLLLVVAGPAWAGATEDENIELTHRFYDEVVNGGNIALIDELAAEDFVEHQTFPGLKPGREGVKEFFTMMRAAFPDLKFDVHFMMADGDKVATYITMSGTHKGEFMGMPPSGKKFTTTTVDIVRIVDGKAVEHWGATDTLTMVQQLGAVPAEPAPAGQ